MSPMPSCTAISGIWPATCCFLWVFADNVEDATGHLRFVLFFALCAAAGAYVHMLTAPDSEQPLIGASGAASGVVAAYLILHPRVKLWVLAFGRIPLRLRAYWVLGAWILFQFGSFLALADDEVSWAAHAGGIVTGAILIPFLKRRDVVLFDRNAEEAVPAAAPGATIAPSTPEPPETAATSAGGDPVLQPMPDSANRPPRVLWGRRDPG